MNDLAIIVVSTNEASWLGPCLRTVFAHSAGLDLDVVVADNESRDGTSELVRSEFPQARVVSCRNRGFAHANNRALMTCDARYVLFLNPDTEIVDGQFADLVGLLDRRPVVGLIGVKQVLGDGTIYPTIRRFPNAVRALGEALGSERFPVRSSWLGERELERALYEQEVECDWTSGSFLLVRREALESAGFMDERFVMSSEETDLCYRIKQAGWQILHLPAMTIIHHAGKSGVDARMEAQFAVARVRYARKHFSPGHRVAYVGAIKLRHLVRALAGGMGRAQGGERREAARRALRALEGRGEPPFWPPLPYAVAPRSIDDASRSSTAIE